MHRKNGSDNAFYFKQFRVCHDRCAMKVGTDGVLLGAWADTKNAARILDIGTGSGLIALMLAQRTNPKVQIDAVEINYDAFKQACENVSLSKWSKRIRVSHGSIQNFEPTYSFDLIVCNPPYFVKSLEPLRADRKQARHAIDLPFQELISSVKRLMHPDGIFCMILPLTEAHAFLRLAGKSNLHFRKIARIKSSPTKPVQRLLIEFSSKICVTQEEEIILANETGNWTQPYLKLVSLFYPWANLV